MQYNKGGKILFSTNGAGTTKRQYCMILKKIKILYDSNFMTFWKRQNYGNNEREWLARVRGGMNEQAEHRALLGK